MSTVLGENFPPERLPQHIAIIMDGNGRWAEARGLDRTRGHEQGERALFDVVEGALEAGVRYLSVYAFSTENWARPQEEIDFLMNFNRELIRIRRDDLHERNVRIRRIGRLDPVPHDVLDEFAAAEEMTKDNTRMQLLVCFNYGGRAELRDAAAAAAAASASSHATGAAVGGDPGMRSEIPEAGPGPGSTHPDIAAHLYAPDVPDVDLLIRTSGEYRLSNFLLWQSAYAELYFTETLWPDFDRHALFAAIKDYAGRDRRFGGIG